MKIPLQYSSAEGRIYLSCVLTAKKYRIYLVPINFILDTGSPNTIISEGDARRINLPIKKLSNDEIEPITRVGGITCNRKIAKEIEIYIKNDEGKAIKYSCNPTVLESTKKDEKSMKIAYSMPSLVGVDFLAVHKLTLYFTPSKNIAYLENQG